MSNNSRSYLYPGLPSLRLNNPPRIEIFSKMFLDASSHLYKNVCTVYVGRSVYWDNRLHALWAEDHIFELNKLFAQLLLFFRLKI